jgi:glycosyltransferase involved in cell wall biosynthesis
MQKTLALVMVVKNEEKGLEKAILSAKPFVNEIVIAVDRASNDSTAVIAKKYATELKFFTWCDDFSWARNFAHEGVKSDYILFLDGHEFVLKCEKLEEALNLGVEGLLTIIKMENGAEFRNPRIYKNGVQFEFKYHERQNCKTVAFYPQFIIQHDREGGQDIKAQMERKQQTAEIVPRVMLERLKADPSDTNASFHLGMHYLADFQYKKALKYQKLYLKYSKLKSERWQVCFSRALTFSALHRPFWAFWAISMAEYEQPGRWETQKLKGIIYFDKRKYEKALECFVKSFDANKIDCPYKPWPRDDAGTWNLIGECFFRRGAFDKASTAFFRANEIAEEGPKKELFLKRAKLMEQMAVGRKD